MRKLLFLLFFVSVIPGFSQDKKFNLDEVYKIDVNGTIDMTSSDAHVYIVGSDRKDVHVKINRTLKVTGFEWGSDDFEVEIVEMNGNLKIREHNSGSVIIAGSISEKYEIWIEAPHDVSLDIDGDDDHYSIKNINGSIAMSIDDGDANFENCNGKDFSFRIDDGDITMDKASGKLSIHADDSDINIRNASFHTIDANIDDGDLILETSLSNSGSYTFDADDSTIELKVLSGGGDFIIFHDDGNVRTSGSFTMVEENEDETKLKLAGGNARLTFNTDDGAIRLNAL